LFIIKKISKQKREAAQLRANIGIRLAKEKKFVLSWMTIEFRKLFFFLK